MIKSKKIIGLITSISIMCILAMPVFAAPEANILGTGEIAEIVKSATDSGREIEWESSDSNIVTVDEEGTVTAVGKGTAFITAKCGLDSATCMVEVGTSSSDGSNKYEYDVQYPTPSDTAPVVTGKNSKGKVVARYIVPVSGTKSEVTVNTGSKFTLKNGKNGTYKIVSDTLGTTTNILKSKGCTITKKGKIGFKKSPVAYDVEVTYTGVNGENYNLLCHVIPIKFANKKIVVYSSEEKAETISLTNLTMENGTWKYTDGVKYNKNGTIKDSKKQYAKVVVSSDNKSVKVTPISGRKGTVKLKYTLNGVKYKMSIKVLKGGT